MYSAIFGCNFTEGEEWLKKRAELFVLLHLCVKHLKIGKQSRMWPTVLGQIT